MRDERFIHLYERAKAELTDNLMPWWMGHAVDDQNGGFFGAVRNDNTPVTDAPRHIVLNARSSHNLLPGRKHRRSPGA